MPSTVATTDRTSSTVAVLVCSINLPHNRCRNLYQHFRWLRVAEKRGGAGGQSIGAGVKDRYEVTDDRRRERHVPAQDIQRRAEASHHGGSLHRRLIHPVGDREGVVAAD